VITVATATTAITPYLKWLTQERRTELEQCAARELRTLAAEGFDLVAIHFPHVNASGNYSILNQCGKESPVADIKIYDSTRNAAEYCAKLTSLPNAHYGFEGCSNSAAA